jgi:Uma2 family endonuclease
MRNTALRIPARMTVAEFQDWQPPEGLSDRRWNLIDGAPVMMAPASENHGRIQAEAAYLLTAHLRAARPGCSVVIAPGVIPNVRANTNERIPDLAVTCTPSSGGRAITDPVLLIEILSPSNEADTRSNVWAYATIPSVTEILLLSSTSIEAELLRRQHTGSTWPADPTRFGADATLALDSIGFTTELRAFYATTSLR